MDDFRRRRDVLTDVAQHYVDRAATRGMDRDEAIRCLAAFRHSFPGMSEHDVCTWLIDEWRD